MRKIPLRSRRVLADAGCELPALPPSYFWRVTMESYGYIRAAICSDDPKWWNHAHAKHYYHGRVAQYAHRNDAVAGVCAAADEAMQYMISDCHSMALRRGRPTLDDVWGDYR